MLGRFSVSYGFHVPWLECPVCNALTSIQQCKQRGNPALHMLFAWMMQSKRRQQVRHIETHFEVMLTLSNPVYTCIIIWLHEILIYSDTTFILSYIMIWDNHIIPVLVLMYFLISWRVTWGSLNGSTMVGSYMTLICSKTRSRNTII